MKIPAYLDLEDYLHNPIMRRFLKKHKLELVNNRADYIHAIENYANLTAENEAEVHGWLLKTMKEGSKEFWYRKFYPNHGCDVDPVSVSEKLKKLYPECPMLDVLSFSSEAMQKLTTYSLEINTETGKVDKINLSYARKCYYGKEGDSTGNVTVFPIFAEIYLKEGFVVVRCKAKSTLYNYNPEYPVLLSPDRVDIAKEAERIIDQLLAGLEYEYDSDLKVNKYKLNRMLYNLYQLYSFTPEDVAAKVTSQEELAKKFISDFFGNLSLKEAYKEKAITDAKILIEKYVSINGDNENVFKEKRGAYLINISTDDDAELTRIDTASIKTQPLQCTEVFYDSKKSIVRSEQCKKMRLVFKREDDTYFTVAGPLVVQLESHKGYGNVKTLVYAEEADIQNVLHAIFGNY